MILIIGTSLEARELDLAPGVECSIESEENASIMMKTVAMNSECIEIYIPEGSQIIIPESVKYKVKRFKNDNHLKRLVKGESEVVDDTATFDFDGDELENNKGNVEKIEDIVESTEVFDEIDTLDDVYNNHQMIEADTSLPDDFVSIAMEDSDDIIEKQLQTKDKIIQQKDIMIKELNDSRDSLLSKHKSDIEQIKQANDKRVKEFEDITQKYKSEIDKAKTIIQSDIVKRVTMYSTSPKAIIKEGYRTSNLPKNIYTIACTTHEDIGFVAKRVEEFIKNGCVIADFTNDHILPSLMGKNVDSKESKNKNTLNIINGDSVKNNVVKIGDKSDIILSDIFHDIVFLNTDWLDVVTKIAQYANGKDVLLVFGSIKNFCVEHAVSVLTSITNTSVLVRSSPINIQTLYCALKFVPNTKDQKFKIIAVECLEKVKSMLKTLGATRTVCMLEQVSSEQLYDIVKK